MFKITRNGQFETFGCKSLHPLKSYFVRFGGPNRCRDLGPYKPSSRVNFVNSTTFGTSLRTPRFPYTFLSFPNRRAQFETFGLVILVALILVIALIAAKFLLVKGTEQVEVKRSVVANNLFNALLKANIGDCGQMNELLIECYETSGKSSGCDCGLAENVIKKVTAGLELEESDYKLTAFVNAGKYFSVGKCEEGVKASTYQTHKGGNSYNFELVLC